MVESLDPPEKAGWMTKQGGSIRTWKRRWFVLKGNALYYFKANKSGTEAKGQIDLTDKSKVQREEKHGKKHAFAVYTTKRIFFMYPDDNNETDTWIKAVTHAVERMRLQSNRTGSATTTPTPQTTGPTATNPTGPATTPVGAGFTPTTTQTQGKAVREILSSAKADVYFLKEEDSKVLEFWQIWTDSLPPREEILGGTFVDYDVATSADMQKLTWRAAGPQNIFIQRMVDFFWNVGAPESEIDRLNDVGALINPPIIGSWIDMSSKGGMDGGWYFPSEIPLKFALNAADTGDSPKRVEEWAQANGITTALSIGRDMGAAPPRQTEFKLRIPGNTFDEQLNTALSAYPAFGFAPIPDEALSIIKSAGKPGVILSVLTCTEGFVRIGMLVPQPDAAAVDRLCPISGASSSEPLLRFAASLGCSGPQYVEFQYLNRGYGYGVYKEGYDVIFHYNVGKEEGR